MKIKLVSPLGISESGSLARQEDTIYPQLDAMSASDRVFVMCDGLGGHAHGEVASAVVAQALGVWMNENLDFSTQPTALTIRKAVAHAQHNLDETSSRFEATRYPMGTTMALLAFGSFGAVAAHIGDTRIYHVRPSNREILYRSRDHSLVNDLFVSGVLNRAEAEASTKKNVLTRAMLAAPAAPQQPDVAFITDIEAGDYFIICTDGMTGTVSDKQIKEVMFNSQITDAQRVVALKILTDKVPHNHSALLLRVDEVEHEAGDHLLVNTERLMCDKMVRRSKMTVSPATMPSVAPAVTTAVAPPVAAAAEPPVTPPAQVAEPTEPIEPAAEEPVVAATETPEATLPPEPQTAIPPAPASKKITSNKLLWVALAALLLLGAVIALLLLNNKQEEKPKEQPKTEKTSEPDVIINNVIPDEPLDTFPAEFPTGSNVAVPPAPRVSEVPMPNVRYETGSNVAVPRVKESDPYPDAFDNKDDYKELEKSVPEAPAADNDVPKQPSSPSTAPPPPRKKASNDPTKSNRNVAVPPPPGKTRNVQVP